MINKQMELNDEKEGQYWINDDHWWRMSYV